MSPLAARSARLLRVCALLAAMLPAAPARADGAWSFESARALYHVKKPRPEDVAVPHVEVDENYKPPRGVGQGPQIEVKSYEVVGATLIPPSDIQRILAPFIGPDRYMSDVQSARDALQAEYEARGFPTVAVTLPKQTLLDGRIRIEVVEARLGTVTVENPGIDWFSEDSVRRDTPHLEAGALVRSEDLKEDLARANEPRDRRVTPVLKAGAEPGTVDLDLEVDDKVPLHGSVAWDNYRTPGTPENRMTARLAYENLWQRQHQLALQYTFVPWPASDFKDVQVWVLSYSAANPWREHDRLFAYAAWSDTASVLPTNTTINSLGQGFTSGLRYSLDLPLPWFDWSWYHHGLTFGIDYKSIQNALVQGPDTIQTPIRYLPMSASYQATAIRPQGFATLDVGADFNFAGVLPGGSKEDFQNNRGGVKPDNTVDGNYVIYRADLGTTIRLPGLLKTLGQGRFVELPPPTLPYDDDSSFVVSMSGQYADQPLVSIEQYPVGGRNSVRGYLEGERFGDHGWGIQAEVRTRALHDFLGGALGESLQGLAFFDSGSFYLRDETDASKLSDEGTLQGFGVGTRASFLDTPYGSVKGEAFLAFPTVKTENTDELSPTFFFQLKAEF